MSTASKLHLRPVSVTFDESGEEDCVVGYEEYRDLTRVLKLDAVLDFGVSLQVLTTYKPVGLATGWFWRDNKFHQALDTISMKSINAGGGAKSAIVTRADNSGRPTRPGGQFYLMLEQARKITIPKLANGQYNPVECEKLWRDEMQLLGYDISKL